MDQSEYKMWFAIRNGASREATLRLEPWGDEFSMPVGTTFEIVARASEMGTPEIEVSEQAIVVWGWPSSVLSVIHQASAQGGPTSGEKRPPDGSQ